LAIRSFPVVTEYLEPNRPVTFIGLAMPMDTVEITATLTDRRSGEPVNLTGCSAICVTTDKDKSTIWDAEITDAAKGLVKTVVQPDVVGMNNVVIKITSSRNDETTFFLGNLSVAADRRETGVIDSIISLTQKLLAYRGKIDAVQQALDTINSGGSAHDDIERIKRELAQAQMDIQNLIDGIELQNNAMREEIAAASDAAMNRVRELREETLAKAREILDDAALEKQARETLENTLAEARIQLAERIKVVNENAKDLVDSTAAELYQLIQKYGQQMTAAGIEVDETNGEVSIYGVKLLNNELTKVKQRLSAAEGKITQEALYAMIDGRVALARLDEEGRLIAEGLYAEVNRVYQELDARAATLEQGVQKISGWVGQYPDDVKTVTQRLDANEASLIQQATHIDNLNRSVTDVTRSMSATEGRITDQILAAEGNMDDLAGVDLITLLDQWEAHKSQRKALAAAKRELSAKITETEKGLEVAAYDRSVLAGAVAEAKALAVDERTLRIRADEAQARQLTQLQAEVSGNISTVSQEIESVSTAQQTTARLHEQLRSDFNNFAENIDGTVRDAVSTAVADVKAETIADAEHAAVEKVESLVSEYRIDEMQANVALIQQDMSTLSSAQGSTARQVGALSTVTNENTAAIEEVSQAQTTANEAMAELRETVAAGDGASAALIEEEKNARVQGDSVNAAMSRQMTATTQKEAGEATFETLLDQWEAHKKQRVSTALYREEIKTKIEEGLSAEAEKREVLAAQQNEALSYIKEEQRALAKENKAVAERVDTLSVELQNSNTGALMAAIQEEEAARVEGDVAQTTRSTGIVAAFRDNAEKQRKLAGEADIESALTQLEEHRKQKIATAAYIEKVRTEIQEGLSAEAEKREVLSTSLNGHSASIAQLTRSLNGVQSQYGVYFTQDGLVGGFEMLGTGERLGAVFDVDSFGVGRAGGGGRVFEVRTDPDGVQRVYIKNARLAGIGSEQMAYNAVTEYKFIGHEASNHPDGEADTGANLHYDTALAPVNPDDGTNDGYIPLKVQMRGGNSGTGYQTEQLNYGQYFADAPLTLTGLVRGMPVMLYFSAIIHIGAGTPDIYWRIARSENETFFPRPLSRPIFIGSQKAEPNYSGRLNAEISFSKLWTPLSNAKTYHFWPQWKLASGDAEEIYVFEWSFTAMKFKR